MDISQRSLELIEDRQSETLNVNVESNQVSMAAPINVMKMPLLDKIPILDSSIGNTRYTGLVIPSFEPGRQSRRSNPFYEEPSRKTSINNQVDGVLGSFPMKYGELPTGVVKW
jgi:hypothetical protein